MATDKEAASELAAYLPVVRLPGRDLPKSSLADTFLYRVTFPVPHIQSMFESHKKHS